MSWAAENSGLFGWVSLAVGVVVAASVLLLNARARLGVVHERSVTLGAAVGALVIAVGAVLAALGGGRELWLAGLGGFLCLWVTATIHLWWVEYSASRRAVQPVESSNARPYRNHGNPSPLSDVFDLPHSLSVRALEAMQDVNRLRQHATQLREQVDQVVRALGPIRPSLVESAEIRPLGDFPEMAHALAAQGVWAPVSVYTTDDDGTPLKGAVVDVLHAFELTVVVEEPAELGSWFQRFWTRARSESVRERMRKLEQAVELQYLGKVRAEIDQTKAQAVAALLQAINTQDNAVVRIGSLIVIKAEGNLAVWTVSELEAADMERHSALLRDPVSALEYLRNLDQQPDEVTRPLTRSADD